MPISVDAKRLELTVLAWLWCQKSSAAQDKIDKSIEPLSITDALQRLVAVGEVERTESKGTKRKPGKLMFAIAESGIERVREQFKRASPPKSTPFQSLLAGPLAAMALEVAIPGSDTELKVFKKLLPIAVCVRRLGLSIPLDKGTDAAKLAMIAMSLGRLYDPPAASLPIKKLPTGELPALVIAPLLGIPATHAAFASIDKLFESTSLGLMEVGKIGDLTARLVRGWLMTGSAKPAAPFDLESFSRKAMAAARDVVETGGAGVSNLRDQVLVASVWERYGKLFGPMSLDVFKRSLRDANGDHVILVCEDRVPADREREFRESEVRTGASVYHYLRI